MRRRLRKFLPIVLIAVAVQIFAPIGATWAASFAASDPLDAAVICHGDAAPAPDQAGQTGRHRAHDACCSVCTVFYADVSSDTPQATVGMQYRQFRRVAWLERGPDLFGSRAGSHAQARAPPQLT